MIISTETIRAHTWAGGVLHDDDIYYIWICLVARDGNKKTAIEQSRSIPFQSISSFGAMIDEF